LNVYADSSFFVSPYVQDSHKADFLKRIANRPSIWLTPLHQAEVANAIFFHVFLKSLKPDAAENAWSEFQRDTSIGVWVLVDLPARAWGTCIDLGSRYCSSLGVRTLDSLHVACALELRADKFWTFDLRQAKLARAVGLDTSP
jgi:predicted nucleic acid-binding protein